MYDTMRIKANLSALYLPLIVLVCNYQCANKETLPCSGDLVVDSNFTFKLADQSGTNLIAAWGARYLSDSVYVTKSDGSLPRLLEIREDGSISLLVPEDSQEAQDSSVTRSFLVYLPDFHGHPKADVDTIIFKYRFDASCYEDFQVFYNDSLYHQGNFTSFISFVKR